MKTPPTYNSEEKVWSGPAIEQQIFDLPLGEFLLNELKKNGDKVIQVGCNMFVW